MYSVRALMVMMCLLVAVCATDQVADASGKSKSRLLNPFLSLSELLKLRGTPQTATQRLLVRMEWHVGEKRSFANGTLDLADDWALWSPVGGDAMLHDFSLGQVFYFERWSRSVRAFDLLADTAFRYWEKVNRDAINAGTKAYFLASLRHGHRTATGFTGGIQTSQH